MFAHSLLQSTTHDHHPTSSIPPWSLCLPSLAPLQLRLACSHHIAPVSQHFAGRHRLYLGKPANIVHVPELLDRLEARVQAMGCLTCSKQFPDWPRYKSHVRKKKHQGLNPEDQSFDEFYIITYTKPGTRWQSIVADASKGGASDGEVSESEAAEGEVTESDAGDGNDGDILSTACSHAEVCRTRCVICPTWLSTPSECLQHQSQEHGFDILATFASHSLNFYERVQYVNYLRSLQLSTTCAACGSISTPQGLLCCESCVFDAHQAILQDHWRQPRFMRPTVVDDQLLTALDDDVDNDTDDGMLVAS
eukprot:m.20219 g.20219  ORF g.20219 m.20219 type:complete len:307 (+) comp8136_c0_seq3:897-1817(+)